MSNKKIVFIIVEGPTDEDALGVIFNRILNKNEVYVHVVRGDVTTKTGVDHVNIMKKIERIVRNYADQNFLKAGDFQEVIHIVDTDGAYIPDNRVFEDSELDDVAYSTDKITTNNKKGIIARNNQKKQVLDRLCSSDEVWKTIPYSCYYMSCNLDHVLHNKMNSTNDEKECDALQFAEKYKDNIDDFIAFITESDFSVTDGYIESWNYIKNDLHSLERHTNLGVYLLNLSDHTQQQ